MPAISLEDLNRQIAQRERELESLRRELDSRRNQFSTLVRRKEELLGLLQQVESDIASLTAKPPAPTEQPKKASPSVPPSEMPAKSRPSLSELILAALRKADKAMTARQLSEEVSRQGFPLTGRNPVKSVESRLQEMKQKRLVRRASGQPGYLLVSSAQSDKVEKPKTTPPPPKEQTKAAAKQGKPTPAAKIVQPAQRGQQLPLRQVLTNVLKNNTRKLLSGSELADLVLATGYKTKSTKFVDAVWAMLGQMENVEHFKGKGYRLKKS